MQEHSFLVFYGKGLRNFTVPSHVHLLAKYFILFPKSAQWNVKTWRLILFLQHNDQWPKPWYSLSQRRGKEPVVMFKHIRETNTEISLKNTTWRYGLHWTNPRSGPFGPCSLFFAFNKWNAYLEISCQLCREALLHVHHRIPSQAIQVAWCQAISIYLHYVRNRSIASR